MTTWSPAMQALHVMAKLSLDDRDVERVRSLIADGFDWGELHQQALAHKLLPLVGRHIHRSVSPLASGHVPPGLRTSWRNAYYANLERNRTLLHELDLVLEKMGLAQIAALPRKGAHLVGRAYRDVGVRVLSDVDLLIAPAQAQAAGEVLSDLGYQQGRIGSGGRALYGDDRRKILYWRMFMNNERPFVRIVDAPFLEQIEVDLCLNLFLPKSGFHLQTESVLSRAKEQGGRWEMDPDDLLLDLCGHLYKEATGLWWIHVGKDLSLSKFLDVAVECRARGGGADAWRSFCERVHAAGLEQPIYYALHHTDLLYEDAVPAHVLDNLRPTDVAYLDEYGQVDLPQPVRWSRPFLDRIFHADRRREVPASRAPE